MTKRKTATDVIRKALNSGRIVNQLKCLEWTGSWRLSSIIYSLRQQGLDIASKDKKVKTRYGITTIVTDYKLR